MKKLILYMTTIAILIFVVGCAGKSFSFADAKTVKVGDSNELVIKKMDSQPYMVKTEQIDGENVVKYIYVSVNGMTGSRKSLSFLLKENKVIQVPHILDELINSYD